MQHEQPALLDPGQATFQNSLVVPSDVPHQHQLQVGVHPVAQHLPGLDQPSVVFTGFDSGNHQNEA
jgi:hypothetical protein